uniref:Uncharacterized protein n=1 Tax=Pipistrellus kuhlii TaxID=59472 RepID=A0A7J7W327_PIPKU|nr:hypothetical protein mPipKuh1_008172 [Pipistrellus kuhlii]
MKIHALEWGVHQPGLPSLTVQEPSGAGGNPVIRGRQCPHHNSAAATASSTSLGQALVTCTSGWLWAAGQPPSEVYLSLRPALGSWGLRGLGDSRGRHAGAGLAVLHACCPGGVEGTGCCHLVAVGTTIFEGVAVISIFPPYWLCCVRV